ncbi:MAG TPA: hypothetical protein VKE69_14700 [Planctomycetota bacterium]|nr:hypothetical protein [Planctomycetota bacterium]
MRIWRLVAPIVAACVAAGVSAQESKPDPAAELEKLEGELKAAQKAFSKLLHDKEASGESLTVADFANEPSKVFLPRFRALADRAKGTDAGMQALVRTAVLAFQTNDSEACGTAIEEAMRADPDSAHLERVVGILGYAGDRLGRERVETWLDQLSKSSRRELRAAVRGTRLRQAMQNLAYSSGARSDDGTLAKAKKLAKELIADYADTDAGQAAKGALFELENLQIGQVAPEIVGRDADDGEFRLTSYRGKVVVLDFWGFW